MMRYDVEPVLEIEAVRLEALYAGIKVELLTTLLTCPRNEPLNQLVALALPPRPRCGDQVVHIEILPPSQGFCDPKPGNRADRAASFEKSKLVAGLRLLSADPADETVLRQMRAQLRHHAEATLDLLVRGGQINLLPVGFHGRRSCLMRLAMTTRIRRSHATGQTPATGGGATCSAGHWVFTCQTCGASVNIRLN